jgi:hypothetical protein
MTDGHWIDDIWHVLGAPKFYLLLDNSSMTHGLDASSHISRQPYFSAEGYQADVKGNGHRVNFTSLQRQLKSDLRFDGTDSIMMLVAKASVLRSSFFFGTQDGTYYLKMQ